MRSCGRGKGHDHRGQCAELDACPKIKRLHQELPQPLANLRQVG
jgi:hypothetical protein